MESKQQSKARPWGEVKREQLESLETVEELRMFAKRLIRYTERLANSCDLEIWTMGGDNRDYK